MKQRRYLVGVALAAAMGFVFASFATSDFAKHLDRDVHAIHCSFVPGLAAPDISGTSDCQVTLMSPYSSVFRTAVWGGLPISLPAMSIFAFLLFWALEIIISRRQRDRRALGFLVLATSVPVAASAIMGFVSFVTLDAACKLCIGIYAASGLALLGAVLAYRAAGSAFSSIVEEESEEAEQLWPAAALATTGYLGAAAALGVFMVAVPALAYVGLAPKHDALIASCGALERPSDPHNVMLPVGPQDGVPAVEVLDPLCPACRAFEDRLLSTGLEGRFARQLLLFPLDNTCNWMVDSAVHPGACVVSEAVLCAGKRLDEVLAWAFAQQEEIRTASTSNPTAARTMVLERFPSLRSCIGSAQVKARLNRSLRWAVRNQLQVLTPQFYIAGVRLCDEDVDIGLNYALTHMLKMHAAGTLPVPEHKPEPPQFQGSAPVAEVLGGEEQATAAAPAEPAADIVAAGEDTGTEAPAPSTMEEPTPSEPVAVPVPSPEPEPNADREVDADNEGLPL